MTEIFKNYIETLEIEPSQANFSAYNDKNFSDLVKTTLLNATNSDDFYKKLVDLKNEQKKTLLYMEELYNQKQLLKDTIQKSELNLNEIKSATYPMPKDENYKFNLNTVSAYETKPIKQIESEIKEFTKVESKPPLPRQSIVTFQETATKKFSSDESLEAETHQLISDDLRRIEKIWENFKVDEEFNPNKKSIDFNKKFEKRIKKDSKNSKKTKFEWVPKLTVPQPFSMTIREQIKSEQKIKQARETQDEREKRIEAELRECSKKFRAQPVPAHVSIPLFEKLKNEEELRKMRLKKMSKEYMDKICKPFKLTEPKNKEKERRHSYSEGQSEFNAQPLPDFYFDEEMDEKIKEIELYKQLKSQMRAIELLKQSKLPNNMQLQEEKKKLEQERAKIFIKEVSKLQKKIDKSLERRARSANRNKPSRKSHDVPDFNTMYKKFVIEMEMKKAENRKNTKSEPFVLLTETRTRPPKEEKSAPKRSNSMSRLNKSLSASMDAFPIKYNESHKLRESLTKEKINDMTRKELQSEHIEKMKKLKQKKIHDQIQEKINYDPKEVKKSFDRQARKLRLDQKAMEEEYEKEISNIYKSVENRKLQFEQIEEKNLRKTIEKKCEEAFRRAGIDPNKLYDTRSSAKVANSAAYNPIDSEWVNE